jgi:signal transduction histidine kinase
MTGSSSTLEGSILVVDDTPANLRLLSQMLTQRGYKVRPVPSGALALSAARAAPPDLILLDVKMPDLDGYATCAQLKADERTRDIPIIFISALDDTADKVKAFIAGGVDYVTKPFQIEEVEARVATHLTLSRLQQQLQSANADLQARNTELDSFAHTVAHDLKSALNGIMGYAELLELDLDSLPLDAVRQSVHTISRMSHKMNNIIEELMLLAGVRNQTVTPQPLDMGRIIVEAQQRLIYMLQESKAELIIPAEWPTAMGYAPWIEEVWVNYLSNAIKYGGTSGAAPRIELGVTRETDDIRFWVRDNGRGLSPAEQGRLFTEFERLDQIRAVGHGLGLSIVKRIVEKLGGQVGVESEVGVGSTFSFTLPAAA